MMRQSSLLEIAHAYLQEGWMCLPIPYREKSPGVSEWQNWRLDTLDKLKQHFNGEPGNIGILLGPPSGNLIDVDLDFPECLPFARIFLPETRQFGRASNPLSHWLFVVEDAPNRTIFTSERTTEGGKKNDVILELRGNRQQTVFPGSTHKESGEEILWVGRQPIHQIGYEELRNRCGRVAAGAVLGRYWPREKGNRHGCALALAGLLLRAGFDVSTAEAFIGAIARIAGNDAELHTNTVKATKVAMDAGKNVTGWRRLSALLNAGTALAKVPEWLGYSAGQLDEEAFRNAPEPEAETEQPWRAPVHWRWLDVTDRKNWNCAPLVWTVENLIAQGNFVLVAAETQTGKTLFGLFMAYSILNGGTLFGLNVSPVERVLYLGLEGSGPTLRRAPGRYRALIPIAATRHVHHPYGAGLQPFR
jgi:hypothetical protein